MVKDRRTQRKMRKTMTIYETTIAKIRELPESLVHEVSDFVDLLQITLDAAESDSGDYSLNLEDYEDRLARGEINW